LGVKDTSGAVLTGAAVTVKHIETANVAGVGGDEIWFNSGDERVYFLVEAPMTSA